MEAAALNNKEIGRYGRQLILPEWGVKGQCLTKSCSVLLVGIGGLGSPACLYLAAAGIGHLGLVDDDVVEVSNLQRQVVHSELDEGRCKVDSAKMSIQQLNSSVKCSAYYLRLSKKNALDILHNYDVILDCTDNVATRYLLNDACVMLHKPLVSGSALRFEGHLTVYHYKDGPCYRCMFPDPPPHGTVTNCSDGGVMGPVPGLIGTLQAMEALKIASAVLAGRMLMYDGLQGQFRTVKLRPRQKHCVVCGDMPSLTHLLDYPLWCQSCEVGKALLDYKDRISCRDYKTVLDSQQSHLLVDVRGQGEFEICHLQHATNIPMSLLESSPASSVQTLMQLLSDLSLSTVEPVPVYICCRRGNDSQQAVLTLRQALEHYTPAPPQVKVQDIIGGLTEWTLTVDPTFPMY